MDLFIKKYIYKQDLALNNLRSVKVLVVHPYNSTDTVTALKNSRFILSERLDFHMDDNLLKTVHTFSTRLLTSLSVDEI